MKELTLEEKMTLYEKLQFEAKIYSDPKRPMNQRIKALRRFDELLEKSYELKQA